MKFLHLIDYEMVDKKKQQRRLNKYAVCSLNFGRKKGTQIWNDYAIRSVHHISDSGMKWVRVNELSLLPIFNFFSSFRTFYGIVFFSFFITLVSPSFRNQFFWSYLIMICVCAQFGVLCLASRKKCEEEMSIKMKSIKNCITA